MRSCQFFEETTAAFDINGTPSEMWGNVHRNCGENAKNRFLFLHPSLSKLHLNGPKIDEISWFSLMIPYSAEWHCVNPKKSLIFVYPHLFRQNESQSLKKPIWTIFLDFLSLGHISIRERYQLTWRATTPLTIELIVASVVWHPEGFVSLFEWQERSCNQLPLESVETLQ